MVLVLGPQVEVHAESPAVGVVDVDRVWKALRGGRVPEALRMARALVDRAPGVPAAHLLLGAAAEHLGEFDDAERAYGMALGLVPGHPIALVPAASLLRRLGEHDEALTYLDWAVTGRPWPVWWLFLHGGDDEKASVVRQDPALRQIAQRKIDVLLDKGDFAQARRLARAFGFVRPEHDYCHDARNARITGPPPHVYRTHRLAVLMTPPDGECVRWFGQWLADEGHVGTARLMIRHAMTLASSPDDLARGARYLRARLSNGREVSRRAEELAMIGRVRHVRDRDAAGATRLLEEAIRLEPAFDRPYLHLAAIAWSRHDHAAALQWLDRASQADPECWRAHRNRGQALVSLGRYAEARPALRTALGLFPDDLGARLMLARTLYALGDLDEYVRQTREALQALERAGAATLLGVEHFLAEYERHGPVPWLPPAPDLSTPGWSRD